MCKIFVIFVSFLLVCFSVEVIARGGGHGGGHGGGRGGSRGGRGSHGHTRGGVHSTYISHPTGGSRGTFGSKFRSLFSTSKSHQPYYNYNPPSQVTYKCPSCPTAGSFPVYHAQPPIYIYRYRNSDSRYSDLLTGLALYNLGRSSSSSHSYHQSHHYVPRQEEKCCMQIITKLKFEETAIPCYLLSSFVNASTAAIKNESTMAAIDVTSNDINGVNQWLNASGELLDVTPQMTCVLWRNVSLMWQRYEIGCYLLQKYANTLKPPGVPISVWLPLTLIAAVFLLCCCQCCCKEKKTKEGEPLNASSYTLYTK